MGAVVATRHVEVFRFPVALSVYAEIFNYFLVIPECAG